MKKNTALPVGGMTGMNEIQVFNNPEFGNVRTMDENGTVLFCGSDVAKALGYSNPRDALAKHCKGVVKRDGVSQTTNQHGVITNQTVKLSFIPESDLYRLVFSSKLPAAEKFTDWVTSDVLPSIRQHGAYLTPETIEAAIVNPDIMIQLCNTIKAERAQKEALQAQALADRPKVQFAEAVEASSGSVKVGDFAKMVSKRNGVQIGQNKLYKWMRDKKILTRDNIPYQRYMKAGYFEVAEFLLRGRPVKMTYITGKGQTYLYKRLRGSELSA